MTTYFDSSLRVLVENIINAKIKKKTKNILHAIGNTIYSIEFDFRYLQCFLQGLFNYITLN